MRTQRRAHLAGSSGYCLPAAYLTCARQYGKHRYAASHRRDSCQYSVDFAILYVGSMGLVGLISYLFIVGPAGSHHHADIIRNLIVTLPNSSLRFVPGLHSIGTAFFSVPRTQFRYRRPAHSNVWVYPVEMLVHIHRRLIAARLAVVATRRNACGVVCGGTGCKRRRNLRQFSRRAPPRCCENFRARANHHAFADFRMTIAARFPGTAG